MNKIEPVVVINKLDLIFVHGYSVAYFAMVIVLQITPRKTFYYTQATYINALVIRMHAYKYP